MSEADRFKIHIRGIQRDSAGEEQVIETIAEGKYAFRAGRHYIRYKDQSLSPEQCTSTVLKFNNDSLVLLRKGAVDTEQRFIPGQETRSTYRTPYGNLDLSARTDRLSIVFDAQQGGHIEIGYDLSVNGAFQSRNTLLVEIGMIAAGQH